MRLIILDVLDQSNVPLDQLILLQLMKIESDQIMASQKMGHVKSVKQVKRAQRIDLNVCHVEPVSSVWKEHLMIHPYHAIRKVFSENQNISSI